MPNSNVPVITIDGPTASGKGTVATRVAERLGFHLLDSGALYRLTALESLRKKASTEAQLIEIAENMDIEYVDSIAKGRVWAGVDALELGLVDELGGLEDAIAKASEKAELEGYRITTYPKKKEFIELVSEKKDLRFFFPNPW